MTVNFAMALPGQSRVASNRTKPTSISTDLNCTIKGLPLCAYVSRDLYQAQTRFYQVDVLGLEDQISEVKRQNEELQSQVKNHDDAIGEKKDLTSNSAVAQLEIKFGDRKALDLENILRILKDEVKHLNKTMANLKDRDKDLESDRAPLVKYCKAVIGIDEADGKIGKEQGFRRRHGELFSWACAKLCC